MKLKVYAESNLEIRGILENDQGHVCSMVFSSVRGYTDLVAFILATGVNAVAVLIHSQNGISYGYRVDDVSLKGMIALAQSGRKGRNRRIDVFCE
jgi:hypothetical protein